MHFLYLLYTALFAGDKSEREAHERFLSQAQSHTHLEYLEREWDRRA